MREIPFLAASVVGFRIVTASVFVLLVWTAPDADLIRSLPLPWLRQTFPGTRATHHRGSR